jgi:tetratricopeptide (TPR) repeat protein
MTTSGRIEARPSLHVPELYREAVSFHREGRLSDAADRCAAILRRTRDHAGSLRLLGVIRAQQGRLETAVRLMRKALARDAGAAEDHNNLGMVLHASGRTEEAIACYEAALALRPRYAIALNNLGISLAALAHHEAAIAHYRDALAIQPDHAEAMSNLGTSLHAMGRHAAAAEQFQAALAIRPDLLEAHINLGHVWVELGLSEAAIACYRSALERQPTKAELHVNLADTLFKMQHREGALHHYDRARTLQPRLGDAHAGMGAVLQEIGKIDEARQCFETAIEIDPKKARYYLGLVRNMKFSPRGHKLAAMLALAADPASLDDQDAIPLHFALGEALADTGDYQRSFEHMRTANMLKRRSVSYDEMRELGEFERIAEVFSAPMMRIREGRNEPSSVPIFIVGMPRSGSTLVEQILASHKEVFGAGEVETLGDAVKHHVTRSQNSSFPEAVPDWTDEQLHDIGTRYLRQLKQLVPESDRNEPITRITDKMLSNFRYLGLIHLTLPNARIIHTCRDPIDTCLSCFSLQFDKLNFTYDLGELGRRYRGYARLMRHWHTVLPPGAILDVRYEDVVNDLEAAARQIVAHCGLVWDDACLRFYETTRPVRTASVIQVRQPIYRTSMTRWRPSEETLRPLLEALGTEP